MTLLNGDPGFDGHFPGDAVLPGMCHVTLALETVRAAAGEPGLALLAIVRARFLRKVRPGETLAITVVRDVVRTGTDPGPAASSPGARQVQVWRCTHLVDGSPAAALTLEVIRPGSRPTTSTSP